MVSAPEDCVVVLFVCLDVSVLVGVPSSYADGVVDLFGSALGF